MSGTRVATARNPVRAFINGHPALVVVTLVAVSVVVGAEVVAFGLVG